MKSGDPHRIPSDLDPIPAWKAWARKLITIRTVSGAAVAGPMAQADYVSRMSTIQQQAQRTSDMAEKTASFWKMENLSSTFLKQAQPGQSLADPALPLAIRPIAHCGMGIAAVELAAFDPQRLKSIIDSFSSPDHRLFAYEGAGAMLALYEPDFFGTVTRGFSLLGLLPMSRLRLPEVSAFLQAFPQEIQLLVAHGYGRMLYFKNHNIDAAIRRAVRARVFDTGSCVQGIAFAYAMVNNSDLDRVLGAGRRIDEPLLKESFENGLVYALEFWEWMAPGFLAALRPSNPYAGVLARRAQADIDMARAGGTLAAFRVQVASGKGQEYK
ncbi:MAG: hypothetical protein ACR2L2_19150 [Acidobacteriota bacterium]